MTNKKTKERKGLNNKEYNTIENPFEIQEKKKLTQYNIKEKIDKKISTNIKNTNIIK